MYLLVLVLTSILEIVECYWSLLELRFLDIRYSQAYDVEYEQKLQSFDYKTIQIIEVTHAYSTYSRKSI